MIADVLGVVLCYHMVACVAGEGGEAWERPAEGLFPETERNEGTGLDSLVVDGKTISLLPLGVAQHEAGSPLRWRSIEVVQAEQPETGAGGLQNRAR